MNQAFKVIQAEMQKGHSFSNQLIVIV